VLYSEVQGKFSAPTCTGASGLARNNARGDVRDRDQPDSETAENEDDKRGPGRNPLRCVVWNVQGLTSKRTSKFRLPDFDKLCVNNDLILLTETWTSEISEICVDNFDYIVLNRTEKLATAKRDSGGLMLYFIKSIADGVELYDKECDDIIWVTLKAVNTLRKYCMFIHKAFLLRNEFMYAN
jgi:hypothetical protein